MKFSDFKLTKKQLIWLCVLLAILAVLVAFYYIGRSFGLFAIFESKENLQNYISSFGPMAPFIFFLIQFLQVIISPIPVMLLPLPVVSFSAFSMAL